MAGRIGHKVDVEDIIRPARKRPEYRAPSGPILVGPSQEEKTKPADQNLLAQLAAKRFLQQANKPQKKEQEPSGRATFVCLVGSNVVSQEHDCREVRRLALDCRRAGIPCAFYQDGIMYDSAGVALPTGEGGIFGNADQREFMAEDTVEIKAHYRGHPYNDVVAHNVRVSQKTEYSRELCLQGAFMVTHESEIIARRDEILANARALPVDPPFNPRKFPVTKKTGSSNPGWVAKAHQKKVYFSEG